MDYRKDTAASILPEGIRKPDPDTLTVSQINQLIDVTLQNAFPETFWVVGELQDYNRSVEAARAKRWRQVYFELVEKEGEKDQVRAKVRAMIWGEAHEAILAKLKSASEKMMLQDGLEVRFLCRVNYYWKWGDLRLVIEDIDPYFTLGQMERARRELIKKLKAQGMLDKNKQILLPPVAQNLGLITAQASAAYHDFIEELKSSGYTFRIYFWNSTMQGEGTEASVTRGLEVLGADSRVEAIIIVRGGGSRSDLIWFDKEAIALAIAACPKPVLTGIGHEIDQAVADLVAHSTFKTPTAIAQFLTERCHAFDESVKEMALQVFGLCDEVLGRERGGLKQMGRELILCLRKYAEVNRERLLSIRRELKERALRGLHHAQEGLMSYPFELRRRIEIICKHTRLKLDAVRKECRLRDPELLLGRGYSLVYNQEGKLLKTVHHIEVGDQMHARLRDGIVSALATKVEKI